MYKIFNLGGVFNPNKLFSKLCAKCPQFQGGDQHDSHELLRHLLESVRYLLEILLVICNLKKKYCFPFKDPKI